uniref:Uncharacterized protein n=1 Tax=Rhizophora mucronata TaxID=61149 RepID=A0A2P2PXR3_RHIMU
MGIGIPIPTPPPFSFLKNYNSQSKFLNFKISNQSPVQVQNNSIMLQLKLKELIHFKPVYDLIFQERQ